jgi:hypothetical protein
MTQRVEISKRLLLTNVASSAATTILNVTVLVWVIQFLYLRIDQQERSLLPVVYAIVNFVPIFTTIFQAGLSRYLMEAYAKGESQRVTEITSAMFVIVAVASCAVVISGALLALFINDLLRNIPGDLVGEARRLIILMFCSLALTLALSPFAAGIQIRQKFVF